MFSQKKMIQNNLIGYTGAAIIVNCMILIVLAIKGIYPFGEGNISYCDMAQSFVPLYYNTFDILHGEKSLFWDWYSGGGVSTIDTFGNFVLSPFSCFFYFVKRDLILESMSVLLMIKAGACALAMSFYQKRNFPGLDNSWIVISGIIYASSGYIIMYYTNMHFLDMMALFPIIIYGVDRLLKDGKWGVYLWLMTWGFMISMYYMFPVCLFIIFYVFIFIKEYANDKYKERTFLFGGVTCIALLLSGVIMFPSVMALLNSARKDIASQTSYFALVWNTFFEQKLFMLYGGEFIGIFVLFECIKRKCDIKHIYKYIILLFLFLTPIFIEITNWKFHIGGYKDFPMRFGYITIFSGIILLGRIIDANGNFNIDNVDSNSINKKIGRIIFFSVLPVTWFCNYIFLRQFIERGIHERFAFKNYWIVLVMYLLIYICLLFSFESKHITRLCFGLVIIQCGIGWYGMLAPLICDLPENGDGIVKNTQLISSMYTTKELNEIDRVKDESNSLNANYPFVLEKAALSNWTWGVNVNLQQVRKYLGYSEGNTRLLDSGGTIFSDAFFHTTDIISLQSIDPRLVAKQDMVNNYFCAQCKYVYPFGILLFDDAMKNIMYCEESSLEYHNRIFNSFNDDLDELIDIYSFEECNWTNTSGIYEFYLPIENECSVYLDFLEKKSNYHIFVNDKAIKNPTLNNKDNTEYPSYMANGLLSCGVFEDEIIKIGIQCDAEPQECQIGVLKLNTLRESIEKHRINQEISIGKSSIVIDLENTGAQYLMLPIGYTSCFVTVNGEKIDAERALDQSLLLIPIQTGNNLIKISFYPEGVFIGGLFSLIGVVLVFALTVYERIFLDNKKLGNLGWIVFYILSLGCICYIFIIPIIQTIIYYFYGKMNGR